MARDAVVDGCHYAASEGGTSRSGVSKGGGAGAVSTPNGRSSEGAARSQHSGESTRAEVASGKDPKLPGLATEHRRGGAAGAQR